MTVQELAKLPAFEIHDRDSGIVYSIGRIIGFGENCTVVNRIPFLLIERERIGYNLAASR